MGWTILAKTTIAANSTSANIDTTGADLIIVVLSDAFTSALTAMLTDNKSNSYGATTVNTPSADINQTANIAAAWNKGPNVGSGHNFTLSGGTAPSAVILAVSGADATAGNDGFSGTGYNGGGPFTPGAIVPSVNGDLIIQAMSSNCSLYSACNSPLFNLEGSLDSNLFTSMGVAAAIYVQPASGSINPGMDDSETSNPHAILVIAFVAAAGVANTDPPFQPSTQVPQHYIRSIVSQ